MVIDVVGPPEGVRGGGTIIPENPGGPCWRWRSLVEACSVYKKGGTYSEENAVPAIFRDRRGDGSAGDSCRVLVDVIESCAETAGKLSLGAGESDVVSTGRPSVSLKSMEIEFSAVVPRGRRTPVDVSRRNRWFEDGEYAEVDSRGAVALEPGRNWTPLLAAVVMCHPRDWRDPKKNSATAGMLRCDASGGDEERSVGEELGVPAFSRQHLKPTT